jgi:hypothetical protein
MSEPQTLGDALNDLDAIYKVLREHGYPACVDGVRALLATNLPAEEDPATREWIAIPAAEAAEEWAARSIEPDVAHTFAMDTRAEAEQFCEEWARFYGLKATVLHRFVGPWEPLEGEQDHA